MSRSVTMHAKMRLFASRWLVAICVMVGLVGQLFLQSHAQLGEMPRATLERLTGLHIGPALKSPACPDMDDAMVMPDDDERHDPAHHSHDDNNGFCPLCPLLQLPDIAFIGVFVALSIMLLAKRQIYHDRAPRAPPAGVFTGLPHTRGPPLSLSCLY